MIMRKLNTFYRRFWSFSKKLLNILTLLVILVTMLLGIMQITAKEKNIDFIVPNEIYALVLGAYIVYNIIVKIGDELADEINSRYEYREYLVKELEREDSKESSIDKIEKSGEVDEDKRTTSTYEAGTSIVVNEQRKTDKKDIIALMLKNNDEITDYFKISKSQAKSSFWFSVISCIVGMGALAIGIYGIVILKDVSVSVISLISGSISELISGTVFWVHNKSALQLNHYYNALHENEKFLSAVNIADKLSIEKREEILVEIIYKQISSGVKKNEAENIELGEKKEGKNN